MRMTDEQINEIFSKLMTNPAAAPENFATLRFNAESLKNFFNAELAPLLEQSLTGDELFSARRLLLIDEYKFFSDGRLDLFVNNFGDGVGLFGLSAAGGNFKILSLCFTAPKTFAETQTLKFLLAAFAKTFLPALLDPNELITAVKKNYSCAAGGVTFSLIQSGNLNLLHAVAEKS